VLIGSVRSILLKPSSYKHGFNYFSLRNIFGDDGGWREDEFGLLAFFNAVDILVDVGSRSNGLYLKLGKLVFKKIKICIKILTIQSQCSD
jgi:hypothetical protein